MKRTIKLTIVYNIIKDDDSFPTGEEIVDILKHNYGYVKAEIILNEEYDE